MAIRKILVPTDFSPSADTALATAVTLAGALGSSIHLFHAIPLPMQPMPPTEALVMPATYWEEVRQSANRRLERIKEEVVAKGIACTTEALEDTPSFAVAWAAKRSHADLIVMGSRGLTGLKHVVLGSVAERTARAAECPVLTVKHESPPSRLRTILVPTDFGPSSGTALELAKSLAKALGPAHLVLVHAYFIPAELQQYVGGTDGIVERISRDVSQQLEKTLTELQKEGISSEFVAVEGNPERVIVETAKSKHVDLIVMGTHGRRGLTHLLLGSVAERVLRLAEPPVLTVRAPAKS